MKKNTVQKAYLGSERVIVDSYDRVFVPSVGQWIAETTRRLDRVSGAYERWCDVPAEWLGGSIPYWR